MSLWFLKGRETLPATFADLTLLHIFWLTLDQTPATVLYESLTEGGSFPGRVSAPAQEEQDTWKEKVESVWVVSHS